MVSDEKFYDWKIKVDREISQLKIDLRLLAKELDGHCGGIYAHGDPEEYDEA